MELILHRVKKKLPPLFTSPHQSDEHSSDITMLCTSIEEEEDMKERWSSRNAIDFSLPGTTAKTTKLLVVVGQ